MREFKFKDDIFEIFTSELSLSGSIQEIKLEARLTDYPTKAFRSPTQTYIQNTLTVVIPIRFDECVISSVDKPEIEAVEYEYGSKAVKIDYDGFTSSAGDLCNYYWSYTAEQVDGSGLPEDLIKFNPD